MLKNLKNAIFQSSILVSLLVVLAGCGIDNTLYNAKKIYRTAQNRPLNQYGLPTPQAVEEYTRVIKKCGYIITEKKNSSQVDDALFLLAKSLYYKGNNQYQAKDQFQNLITNFPDSPFVTEATLLLAQTYRQINQPRDAENTLTAYIRNKKTARWHPRALLLLADFAIADQDFPKAQSWLEITLGDYADNPDSKAALFLLGKNYFEQKQYRKSQEYFNRLLDTRGITKTVKLDARYYVALNYLFLNEVQKSLSETRNLLKEETRPEKLPVLRVLLGRVLMAENNQEEAAQILQSIITANPKTLPSAEAYYRLAEHFYYRQNKVQEAIDNYNKVKSESSASPYMNESIAKSNALTTIYKAKKISLTQNTKEFLDKKLEIAEQFYNVLSLPDSAFQVFDEMINLPKIIQMQIDSLNISSNLLIQKMDSLKVVTDSLNTFTDSLQTLNLKPALADTVLVDSLLTDNLITQLRQDSLAASNRNRQSELNRLTNQLDVINQEIGKLETIKSEFETEYVPYTLFVKAALIYRSDPDTTSVGPVYSELKQKYPRNKYTNALTMLLSGQPVEIKDPALEQEESEMDMALTDISANPDSALAVLNRLSSSTFTKIRLQANFRLGWYYLFEHPDTLKAKSYFNETIKTDRNNDFTNTLMRFYDGKVFTFKTALQDSLSGITTLSDSLSAVGLSDSINPSLKNSHPQDSDRNHNNTTPKNEDSLKGLNDKSENPIMQHDFVVPVKPDIIKDE
jgi:TolA-binding protein